MAETVGIFYVYSKMEKVPIDISTAPGIFKEIKKSRYIPELSRTNGNHIFQDSARQPPKTFH